MRGFFKRNKFSSLNYGMIHSLFGDCEGVSIVMKQIEDSLHDNMGVKRKNVFYLTGKSGVKGENISENKVFWHHNEHNLIARKKYAKKLNSVEKKKVEQTIAKGVKLIREFVLKNKIDVLISHNSSHPVNFIMSLSLSRYFSEEKKAGREVVKHFVWWHDSHLERDVFCNPSIEMQKYLVEGVPGPHVDWIFFINSTQYENALNYFKNVDSKYPGFLEKIEKNHSVVYNTTDLFIQRYSDLSKKRIQEKELRFLNDFNILDLCSKNKISVNKMLFCLQPTRMVGRKRIDFALKYAYSLLEDVRRNGIYDAMYFLVSGHDTDGVRKKLEKLNSELKKKHKEDKFFLVFAEDYYKKTKLQFLDYPLIFSRLGGFATYFSELEGFGNNLLEVLASGLPVVVYEYPVFKHDIKKFGFDLVSVDQFRVIRKSLHDMTSILKDSKRRFKLVKHNLNVLKENLGHDLISQKLEDALRKS